MISVFKHLLVNKLTGGPRELEERVCGIPAFCPIKLGKPSLPVKNKGVTINSLQLSVSLHEIGQRIRVPLVLVEEIKKKSQFVPCPRP